jgi:hypothetical protein
MTVVLHVFVRPMRNTEYMIVFVVLFYNGMIFYTGLSKNHCVKYETQISFLPA